MRPRLVCGIEEFEFGLDGATIGRDKSNTIHLDDPLVSSFHCRIELQSDQFVLLDCNSLNGTFVNGHAIEKTRLVDGDDVCIGRTEFRFAIHEYSHALLPVERVRLEDSDDTSVHETVRLVPSQSALLNPRAGLTRADSDRLAQGMAVLLKLSAEINEAADSRTLQELVLERIFELIPADNGAIVLASANNDLILSSAVLRQGCPDSRKLPISKTVTQTVMNTGQCMLRNHLLGDTSTSDSLREAQVSSVLCVPLIVMGTRLGVLYLNATGSKHEFNEWHLELATAIAGVTGIALSHLRYVEWLEAENEQLKHEIDIRHDMVGKSSRILKVLDEIARVASTHTRVLILGESGTGKELAARAIHQNSDRRSRPFVAVNLAEKPDTLFASELFGHVRGAFTGADRDKKGFIQEADGGTLFLDEIGDLPLHLQPALLRVIEQGVVYRLGSTKAESVDIRVISATNRSLKSEAETGRFRRDLFFRLGVVIEMPPLRERLEDIPLLVRFFLEKYRRDSERELSAPPPETIQFLQEYHWPGNIRELEVAIQSAVVFGKSDRLRPEDFQRYFSNTNLPDALRTHKLDNAKQAYERQFILQALKETHGVVSAAAALLDRSPTYLHRRISQLGLRDDLDRIRGGE